VIKKLNDLPKEIRIKFWEQIEKLINMRPPSPQSSPLPSPKRLRAGRRQGRGGIFYVIPNFNLK
jgi:hypothetical protein